MSCLSERKFPPEPLLSSALPERLWQKVASDLFCWQGQTFLLVADHFSRYVELAPLKNGSSASEVIEALKRYLRSTRDPRRAGFTQRTRVFCLCFPPVFVVPRFSSHDQQPRVPSEQWRIGKGSTHNQNLAEEGEGR